jgi:hypothetical protein
MLLSIEGSTEKDYCCCEKIEDNFYEEINKLKVTETFVSIIVFSVSGRLILWKYILKEQ